MTGPVSVPVAFQTTLGITLLFNSKADQDITFYLNGDGLKDSQATSAGLNYFDGIRKSTGIRQLHKYNILDGDLSDVYFVDGQALNCGVRQVL